MVQFWMVCPTTVSSTDATAVATTGGPFDLPEWAPDILWATTTLDNDWPVLIATTSPIGGTTIVLFKRTISTYLNRTFGIVAVSAAAGGNKAALILLTYRAVGELTRT